LQTRNKINSHAYFLIGGGEKKKVFNEWLVEFLEFAGFVELRVPQSFS